MINVTGDDFKVTGKEICYMNDHTIKSPSNKLNLESNIIL